MLELIDQAECDTRDAEDLEMARYGQQNQNQNKAGKRWNLAEMTTMASKQANWSLMTCSA